MSNSPNAGFNLQVTGSNNGTWGTNLNSNFSISDGLYGGRVTVNCAGSSNITVSASQAQNFFQVLTGALTGSILYILPATGGQYCVINNTTGAYTLTVVNNAAGTGVVVAQGTAQYVASDPDNTTVYGVIPSTLNIGTLSVTGQITSTLATGSSPFVVASTTPVANLSIGGNAATATTATLSSTVTTNANLTGGVTSVGNAATVVTNANLTGPITSTGNAVSSLTAHNVLLGNGASAIAYAAPSTAGQALISNGASSNPSFQVIAGLPVVTNTSSGSIVIGAVTLQWGSYNGGGSSPTITFGTAFSDTPYMISGSTTQSGFQGGISVTSPTSTNFVGTARGSGGSVNPGSFSWFAIGPT